MLEKIIVKEIKKKDLEILVEINHNYKTDYVWQMDIDRSSEEVVVRFRQTRLPRTMEVKYPRHQENLTEDLQSRSLILGVQTEGKIKGYISLMHNPSTGLVNVMDLVIAPQFRYQGYASALLESVSAWADKNGADRVILEMQSKNFPAISLAQKMGFEFCGYSDRYYDNQDIALFFSKRI